MLLETMADFHKTIQDAVKKFKPEKQNYCIPQDIPLLIKQKIAEKRRF